MVALFLHASHDPGIWRIFDDLNDVQQILALRNIQASLILLQKPKQMFQY
jgi:hypothetical protein